MTKVYQVEFLLTNEQTTLARHQQMTHVCQFVYGLVAELQV